MSMRLILATCSEEHAESLLLQLLEERLVGCGNLVAGVVSHYWWQGKIERDTEVLMLMETSAEQAEAAVTKLRELHPYDVPKILVIEPDQTDAAYAEWLRGVVKGGRPSQPS